MKQVKELFDNDPFTIEKLTKEWGKPYHLREHYEERFNTDLTIEHANIIIYISSSKR